MDDSELLVAFDPQTLARVVAGELNVRPGQVLSAVQLLDEGNTIPFIARYRKEVTGGLDERALRVIEDAATAARELAIRKTTVLRTIASQDQLTDELRRRIEQCADRVLLEELYLPFRPRKRTRAQMARERGLQPLADLLLAQAPLKEQPAAVLNRFVSAEKDVPSADAALQGACDIVAEAWAETPAIRSWVLEEGGSARLVSKVKRGKQENGAKFEAYFDCGEPVAKIPSHRFLAMQRGADDGILKIGVELNDDRNLSRLKRQCVTNPDFVFREQLEATAEDCYRRLLQPAVESHVMQHLKRAADVDAIAVFAANLRELLLAPPAGPQVTIGIDPGFRTGCKVAVVDATGRFLVNETIYPTPPRSDVATAEACLLKLISKYKATLIAIGNGTASRETDRFVADVVKKHSLTLTRVVVSEAGASVYSASEVAGAEYPDLDLTVRGAISIAHRLQDPLSELVKIDPRSIGVGQYQHDVDQTALQKALQREVESCVSSVGVDVNTASPALLGYVAGIGGTLAKRIVEFRDENGPFQTRSQLLKVPRLGQRAFQQAAGFLRIRDGRQPLDNSAVHPEQYDLVRKMAHHLQVAPDQLVGNDGLVRQLAVADFVDGEIGEFTVRDVLAELAKPGRDPRREFKVAQFSESVQEISDLAPGMRLEGTVTNVTRFGAFVDIGVHQDGLIHISQLANHFVRDPSEVVAVGDIVQVTVLEVDAARKRISLSRKAQPASN